MTTNTTSTASQAPAVSIDSEEFRSLLIAARFYGDDPTHYMEGKDALVAHIDAKLAQAESRATAAEAKLEAIRQGVEGLIGRPDNWIKRDEVLALLQPQHQADESGLPG